MTPLERIRDIEALGVRFRFGSYKLNLSAPDKTTYTTAIQRLQAAMNAGEYQTMVDLIQTRDAFAWNVPPDPCEGEGCRRYHRIAELRAVCLSGGLSLAWTGRALIPLAGTPYTGAVFGVLAYVADLIQTDLATLMEHAELFPELDPLRARRHVNMLQRHHAREGFIARGWMGCQVPVSWPEAVRDLVQTIYAASLQEPVPTLVAAI